MNLKLKLDDNAVTLAVQIGNFRSKSDAVNAALREYVRRRQQALILELAGTIRYFPDYDYKRLRGRKAK